MKNPTHLQNRSRTRSRFCFRSEEDAPPRPRFRTVRLLGAALLVGALSAAPQVAQSVPIPPGGNLPPQTNPDYSARAFDYQQSAVNITWDDHGVAAVDAETDPGAFFGWGYAMAVDRFFQMEIARRIYHGRVSELLGRNKPAWLEWKADPITGDVAARSLRFLEIAEASEARMLTDHPEHMILLEAFGDGVNHYLEERLGDRGTWDSLPDATFQTRLEGIDDLFEQYPLTADHFWEWTRLDTILARWRVMESPTLDYGGIVQGRYDYDSVFTGTNHDEAVLESLGAIVLDEDSMAVQQSDVPQAQQDALDAYAAAHGWDGARSSSPSATHLIVPGGEENPKFSHNWAVGGDRTETGRSVLVGMPQLPTTRMLFEIGVKGETFTSHGIGFCGAPGYLVGFNDDVAWGACSAGTSPSMVLRLPKSRDGLKYRFNGAWHAPVEIPSDIPYRTAAGAASWSTETIQIQWADAIRHDDLSDPNGEQSTRMGVPLITNFLTRVTSPTNTHHFAVMHYRHFDNSCDSLISNIDCLRATSVSGTGGIEEAMLEYTNPALGLTVGDKEGNIGYWFARRTLLHPANQTKAPLGAWGAIDVNAAADLPLDLIPMNLMPHVINPLNQTTPGVRSNLEDIVLNGNNGAVGSWYPIPVYSGTGDSLRSWRLRQLLSSKFPDEKWSSEEVLSISYDDVAPFKKATVSAALYQRTRHGAFLPPHLNDPFGFENAGVAAAAFIDALLEPRFGLPGSGGVLVDWSAAGGHMHSSNLLSPVLAYIGAPFRYENEGTVPSFPELAKRYGSAQTGRVQFFDALAVAQGQGLDLFNMFAGDPSLDQQTKDKLHLEIEQFLTLAVGNAWLKATSGIPFGKSAAVFAHYTGVDPALWHGEFLGRFINGDPNLIPPLTSGAGYHSRFHEEREPYYSMDPTKDTYSPILHNPSDGLSNQSANIYTQFVHFNWHDDPPLIAGEKRYPFVVFNPGNSLHPNSPYFVNDCECWARDGLLFDLEAAQADPTMYLRECPLIELP